MHFIDCTHRYLHIYDGGSKCTGIKLNDKVEFCETIDDMQSPCLMLSAAAAASK